MGEWEGEEEGGAAEEEGSGEAQIRAAVAF